MITALETLVYGWGRSSWVIGLLPIHLGRTSSTSSSIAAIRRASTEGAMCLLTPTPKASWNLGAPPGPGQISTPRRLGVWEPLKVMEYGVQVSWSLEVWESSSYSRSRRNVGFWVEMGENMDVATFERGVKKVMRAMLEGRDILVHCIQGKHRSGSFLTFVAAIIDDIEAEFMISEYLQDPILRPHDRGCVFRVWREGGLRPLLAAARLDREVQHLVEEIHARMDEASGRQGVEASRRPGVEAWRQGVEASGCQRVEASGRESQTQQEKKGVKRPSEAQSQQEGQKRAPLTLTPNSSSATPSTASRGQGVERPQGSAGSSRQPCVGNYRYKAGDWQCPECGNWNYSGRQTCNFNDCQLAYWKRGDWNCTVCGNHNYASRTTCNKRSCQAPRP